MLVFMLLLHYWLSNVVTEDNDSLLQESVSIYTLRKDRTDVLHTIISDSRQFNHLIEQEIEMR